MTLIKTEYRVRCDTVWASPGKCKCEAVVSISDKMLDPGFYIHRKDGSAIFINGFTKEVWNLAIETAASVIDQCNREGSYEAIVGARRIRELKK